MDHAPQVIIEHDKDGYFAYVPERKGCHTQGDSMEEVIEHQGSDRSLLEHASSGKILRAMGGALSKEHLARPQAAKGHGRASRHGERTNTP